MMKQFLILVGFSLITIASAQAGTSLSIIGVGSMANPSATSNGASLSYSSQIGFGGGAILGVGLAPMFDLEVGAEYYSRKYKSTDATSSPGDTITRSLSMPVIEVPVDVKLNMGPFYARVGGYMGYIAGNISTTVSDTLGTNTSNGTSSQTATTAQWKRLDYGALGGVGLAWPLTPMTMIRMGGDYQLSLSNSENSDAVAADPTAKLKFNSIMFYAGVQLKV